MPEDLDNPLIKQLKADQQSYEQGHKVEINYNLLSHILADLRDLEGHQRNLLPTGLDKRIEIVEGILD